jgi:hypothetical protein
MLSTGFLQCRQKPLVNGLRLAGSRDNDEFAATGIGIQDRLSLLAVNAESLANGVVVVIGTSEQGAFASVALLGHPGGAGDKIIDVAALPALASGAKTGEQLGIVHIKGDGIAFIELFLVENGLEVIHLTQGSGEAVKEKTGGGIPRAFNGLAHQLADGFVGNQFAGVDDFFDAASKRSVLMDGGA